MTLRARQGTAGRLVPSPKRGASPPPGPLENALSWLGGVILAVLLVLAVLVLGGK